jgi:hypothetical protein
MWSTIKQIFDTANTPCITDDPTSADANVHAGYHKRIVLIGACFGIVGLILGLVASFVMVSVIAANAFFISPVGWRWMNLIGTKNPLMARIACILFVIFIPGFLVGVGVLVSFDKAFAGK